jgi:peroxiredoxin family protein
LSSGGSRSLAIIVRSDNPESVYPALIIASTAASMGVKVEVFFTFWGLRVLVKGGIESVERKLREAIGGEPRGIPPLSMLLEMARKSGVEIYACSTTIQAMGLNEGNLIEGCPIVGAATFVHKHVSGGSRILVF